MKSILIKFGGLILRALPIEQILAAAINKAIARIDEGNMAQALKTVEHIQEICDLTTDILADRTVTEEEAGQIVAQLRDLKLALLGRWADGQPCKDVQVLIETLSADNPPSYV